MGAVLGVARTEAILCMQHALVITPFSPLNLEVGFYSAHQYRGAFGVGRYPISVLHPTSGGDKQNDVTGVDAIHKR